MVEDRPGVYGLFYEASLVYVGKATDDLRHRLNEHRTKIGSRKHISLDEVAFSCLVVNPNWNAYAPESILINHYRARGEATWNGSGFGMHDPGRERETTNKPPQGFDAKFPIDEHLLCPWAQPGVYPVLDLLVTMKDRLPYLLRYQRDTKRTHYTKGHRDMLGRVVEVPAEGYPHSAAALLSMAAAALPGWQATVFPSHLILYKEERDYRHGEVL